MLGMRVITLEQLTGMTETSKNTCGASPDLAKVKHLAKRGAIWVTLTSAAAIPLAYYRNWILGSIGDAGEVVGNFAIILLFLQIVSTFVLFGGSSVVTNFLPKIKNNKEKFSFLFTYSLISIAAVTLFIVLINFFPGIISFLIQKPVGARTLRILSCLAPAIVLAQLITFSLAGLMQFRLAAMLGQLQLFFVCILATSSFLFFPQFLQDHATLIFALTIGAASLGVIILGTPKVINSIPAFTRRLHLPTGFWRFSCFVHLNTVCTFAYTSADQLFILAILGTKELGAYFILLQCAQLINFISVRIGQVMLASFSHLVGSGDHEILRRAYIRLARIILIISTPLALIMILFSHPIARLFGAWYAERHLYLILLAATIQIGALGSLNSMLIMAKDRAGLFLVNNITLIILQLVVTILFLGKFGIYAVIAGKATGVIAGQTGLFLIARYKLNQLHLSPPKEYWVALATVSSATTISIVWLPLPSAWSALVLTSLVCGFLFVIRFRMQEIRALIDLKRNQSDKNARN